MGKRLLNLYVEDGDVELAKAKNINLSLLFREILNTELRLKDLTEATTKEELINKLKAKVSLLSGELKIKNEETELLKQKVKNLTEQYKNETGKNIVKSQSYDELRDRWVDDEL